MKVLVTVQRVEDPETKIKIKPDGTGIITENVKYVVNPFDEIAVEEGLRIKEKLQAEVVVVSVGSKASVEQIRTALAMGADRGIMVEADGALDSAVVADVLAKVIGEEKPDIVIMGKQAVDGDSNQAGQILAELLGYGQATFASKLDIDMAAKKATVKREVDGGAETLEIALPGIVTADLRLNEPRYATLPGIMKAKKKPVAEKKPADYGVTIAPKIKVLKLAAPPARKAGKVVESVEELISALQNEAKVI